jgi:hypothetical protein
MTGLSALLPSVESAAKVRFEPILTVSRNAANVRFRDLVFVLGRAC